MDRTRVQDMLELRHRIHTILSFRPSSEPCFDFELISFQILSLFSSRNMCSCRFCHTNWSSRSKAYFLAVGLHPSDTSSFLPQSRTYTFQFSICSFFACLSSAWLLITTGLHSQSIMAQERCGRWKGAFGERWDKGCAGHVKLHSLPWSSLIEREFCSTALVDSGLLRKSNCRTCFSIWSWTRYRIPESLEEREV